MFKPHKDFLVGQTFGRLTVIKRLPKTDRFGWAEIPNDMPSSVLYKYECECSCGTKGVVVKERDLVGDRKKSCGCVRKELQKAYWDQKTDWKRQQKRAIDRRELGKAILAALRKDQP